MLSVIEITALICSIIIYLGFFTVIDRHPFKCLKPLKSIDSVYCCIDSTILKNNKDSIYTASAKVFSCDNWTATGKITLFIPSQIIENHYPGKLFSKKGLSDCIEQGANVLCSGKMINNKEENIETVFSVHEVKVISWKNIFCRYRALLRLALKRLLFSWGEAGGFLLALLCGTKEYTCTEISDGFMKAGIAHIIALSGMHVSFFSNSAILITSFLFGKKYNTFFSLLIVTIFVWFAGVSPSLLRALLCCYIANILSFLYIKHTILSVISLSFLIQIVFFPTHITAVSFLLSYTALIGIILIGEKLNPLIARFLPPSISESISSSIGAQICTIPISIKIFNCIMPIGIIASVLITPLVFIFLAVGTICCLLSIIFPFCCEPLGVIINFIYNIIKYFVLLFAKVPPMFIRI